MTANVVGDDVSAGDVDGVRHRGIKFAGLEGTVADGVEYRAKTEAIEELPHANRILGVLFNDTGAIELPRLPRPDADNLAGVFVKKMMKRIEARDAGDAGHEQWQAVTQHAIMIAGLRLAPAGVKRALNEETGNHFVKSMVISLAPLVILAVNGVV